jgi:hypothetical protein
LWDQFDSTCPVLPAKISDFSSHPNHLYNSRHPGPHTGAFRDRHERKVGMRWTRMARLTSVLVCGRRSRVVLTSRRWRQASQKFLQGDGDNKARSPGRARRKPLKPSRAGMPGDPGATVVTNACVLLLYTRGCGCDGHPAFPAPFTGERYMHNSGAISAAGMRWRGCELKQRHSRFDATFRPGIPDRHTGYPLTPRSSMVPREFVRCEPDNSLISKVWVRSP